MWVGKAIHVPLHRHTCMRWHMECRLSTVTYERYSSSADQCQYHRVRRQIDSNWPSLLSLRFEPARLWLQALDCSTYCATVFLARSTERRRTSGNANNPPMQRQASQGQNSLPPSITEGSRCYERWTNLFLARRQGPQQPLPVPLDPTISPL
jgi:hypothetical protein